MEEPEDMEDRRLADLEKFALNHPDHPMVPRLMQQVRGEELAEPEAEWELGESKEGSWYHWLRGQQLRPASKGKRQFSGKQGAINKWDKASSLELIAELEKFQETLIELSERGIKVTSDSRWAAIARNLPNRYGLEPAKFARRCKVHFLNLGRVYREQKKNSKGEECLDAQVRQALEDYFQLGGENAALPPPRKGLEVNATNVKMSTMFTDKIERGDKCARMAGNTTATKPSNMLFEKIVNWGSQQQIMKKNCALRGTNHEMNNDSREGPSSTVNPNTKRMKKWESPVFKSSDGEGHGAAESNEDPYEREELGNPHRRDQRVNPPMDSAILKRWESPVFKSSDGKENGAAEANEDPYEREEFREELGKPHRRDLRVNPTTGSFLKRWESPVFKSLDGKGSGLAEPYEDPQEQEEQGNPHRRDQRVIPTMDDVATLKGWDTASSVQLLATMAKVGAKAVNGWERVASLLPNHNRLDPQEFARSCKEQYRDLLRTHKGKWKENSGHEPLADEVTAQLEKLLQSSKENMKNKEVSRVERRGMASERVGVKPQISPPVIEKFDEEGRGVTKTFGLNKELDSGVVAKNRKEAGFVKANGRLQNHLPIGNHCKEYGKNSMNLDSDTDSEKNWDEYRRMIKKRPRDEEEEWEPENPVTIGKTYIDLLESRIPVNASPDPKDLNQFVDMINVSCEDNPEHLRSKNIGIEGELIRGGATQQRTLQDKGEEAKNHTAKNFKIGGSKYVHSSEKVTKNAKLKKLWQEEGYRYVEDGGIGEGKHPKGLKNTSRHERTAATRKPSSHDWEQLMISADHHSSDAFHVKMMRTIG